MQYEISFSIRVLISLDMTRRILLLCPTGKIWSDINYYLQYERFPQYESFSWKLISWENFVSPSSLHNKSGGLEFSNISPSSRTAAHQPLTSNNHLNFSQHFRVSQLPGFLPLWYWILTGAPGPAPGTKLWDESVLSSELELTCWQSTCSQPRVWRLQTFTFLESSR